MRIVKKALQLLIVLLWAFMIWRYRDLPWFRLAFVSTLFGGLLLLASALGTSWLSGTRERTVFYVVNLTLLAIAAAVALPVLPWRFVLPVLLLVWWFLLAGYMVSPALGDLPDERRYFHVLGKEPGAVAMFKRSMIALFFWPIFIPKTVWFWGLALSGSAWLLRGLWLRQP